MNVSHSIVSAIVMTVVLTASTTSFAQQSPAGGFNATGEVRVGQGAAPTDPNRLPAPRSDHDAAPQVAAVDMPPGGVVRQAGIGGDTAYGRPGVIELGGSAGLTIGGDLTSFNISPTVGWFFANNLQLSGIIDFRYQSNSTSSGASVSSTYLTVLVEPSYHLPINRSLFAFLGVGLGLGYNEGAGFALAPRLGMNIMIGRSGILTPALQFVYTTQSVSTTPQGTLIAGGTAFGLNIGYTIML